MITFITGNEHKVIEAENIFKNYDISLEHIDLGYTEPQGTLEEVALSGAKYACHELKRPVIVEDAGLFIKALNGFPGTYSHYVQDTIGNQGILKLLTDSNDRYAEFRSVIGYCAPNSEPKTFLGKVKGEIAVDVPSVGKTFGELTTDEKNQFSHRKNSLEEFIKWYSAEE